MFTYYLIGAPNPTAIVRIISAESDADAIDQLTEAEFVQVQDALRVLAKKIEV